jgi:two-component system, NarL family, sensor histidine kinase DegS
MRQTHAAEIKPVVTRIVKNPHFWVILVVSVALILLYQAWPWRQWESSSGFARQLSGLGYFIVQFELRIRILGVLFFIPIIYGAVTLSWPGGAFAWLLSLIWLLPRLFVWSGLWLPNLVLLLLPALLAAIATAERRWREREKLYFAERERQRQAYVSQLVDAQEAERRRIAQEIHDETLQTLLVVANKLDTLSSSCPDDEHAAGDLWVKRTVLKSAEDLRRLSMNLRPSILDNFGLVSGVRWLVNNICDQETLQTSTLVRGQKRQVSSLVEVAVFRVVQEAMFNIKRHAHATNVSVMLEFGEADLTLEIVDDGVGFEPPDRLAPYAEQGRLGMIGMEQRIKSVGGTMIIDSRPGAGTTIRATIPCPASEEVVKGKKARLKADEHGLGS